MVIIRKMTAKDLARAYEINQSSVPAVGAESLLSFEHLFQLAELSLVLEIDEIIQGFCMIFTPHSEYQSPNYLYFKERYQDFIYLDRIALTEIAQNRGFGPLLYQEVIKQVNSPYFALEVNIKPPNEGSLRFHLREGFRVIAEEETRPGKVVALMLKELDC